MSDLLQSEEDMTHRQPESRHPDADQLSAFLEQALPEHERLETLAHLAGCSDCREIVALSLPPLEDAPIAAAAPLAKPRSENRFIGWLTGWKLVWVAVPALAALVVLTIYLRGVPASRRASAPPAQMADSIQRTPAPTPPVASAPVAEKPPRALKPAPAERPAIPARPSPAVVASVAPSSTASGREGAVLPPSQPATGQAAGGTALKQGAMTKMSNGFRALPAPELAGPEKTPPPTSFSAAALADAAPTQPPLQYPQRASAAGASVGSAKSSAGTIMTAQSRGIVGAASSAPGRPTSAFALHSSVNGAELLTMPQSPLPSGLATLAVASRLGKTLAIDTRNQLFFSNDGGQHWKAISPLWKGRAIAVAAVSATPSRSRGVELAAPERFSAGIMASVRPADAAGSLSLSLRGAVKDTTGAAIPGATVIATDSCTALVRKVQTDASGRYVVKDLPPGVYCLEASASGFLKQSQTVAVGSSQQDVGDIVLPVGASSQTVTVEASSAQLDTLSSTMPDAAAKVRGAAKTSAALSLPPALPPRFIVTTDTGERWSSADGETWKRE